MEKHKKSKKLWVKPIIHSLNIKKDTFSGSGAQAENPGNHPITKYGTYPRA